jgi:hypothetical protein
VGHTETVWADFLSHHERCRADLNYELVCRRLCRCCLSREGMEGDPTRILAGCREFPVEV